VVPRLAASFLFLLLIRPSSLSALEIPKRPEGYVSDYAGMVSRQKRIELEEKLRRFEQETSNQIVVVTFPSLEGEVLEDFAIRLAEAWKIGQKGKDNGVILLIFKNDRKVRIEVGYGLEGALTDATSRLIIENEMVPRFREGKFDEGIEAAVQAIMAATQGEYHGEAPASGSDRGFLFMMGIFLGALLPLLLLRFMFFAALFFLVWSLVQGSFSAVFLAFVLGVLPLGFFYLLGRHLRGSAILSRRGFYGGGGGFGGGGFGGGGGGSFGGGGASGRW